MAVKLKAPFPWFGGKSLVAGEVWQRFGKVDNYVEPFAGSLAVLLGSPCIHRTETVNDIDGFISNFWRAVAADPERVAHYADWPVNENDLHARHAYLVGIRDEFMPILEGDPDFFDAKIAGWWCWGIGCWIGSGWCSGNGPWAVRDRQLVHMGDAGQGVSRQLVHLGDAGQGVNHKRGLMGWIRELSDRLRRVRVCCGDWERVLGPAPTTRLGRTAVFLDPPYSDVRQPDLYRKDDLTVADRVRQWCQAHENNPMLRIVLCGYQGEHDLSGWGVYRYSAKGGYVGGVKSQASINRHRECLFISPSCAEGTRQQSLF